MASKKTNSTRSKSQGKPAPKTPAEVLREAKAQIDEIHANSPPPPRMSTERHPASDAAEAAGKARDAIASLQVPMTLGEVAEIIGAGCDPSEFPVSSVECLADQLDAISQMAEMGAEGGFERWKVVDNIVNRMRLASRVTAWMLTNGEAQS